MNAELLNSGLLDIEPESLPASGLTLDLKANPWLMKLYLVFFVLLIVSLSLLPISFFQIGIVIILSIAYFQFIFRKYLLLNHPESIEKVVFTDMDWCFIQLKNAKIFKATILPDSILTEHLVILNLKKITKKNNFLGHYSVLITHRSVDNNKFWLLKRYLRFKKFNSEASKI